MARNIQEAADVNNLSRLEMGTDKLNPLSVSVDTIRGWVR
jgi:hypothetical protein